MRRKSQPSQISQRLDHHGLGQARNANDQHVAAREEAREKQTDDFLLADQHNGHLFLESLTTFTQAVHLRSSVLEFIWVHLGSYLRFGNRYEQPL